MAKNKGSSRFEMCCIEMWVHNERYVGFGFGGRFRYPMV